MHSVALNNTSMGTSDLSILQFCGKYAVINGRNIRNNVRSLNMKAVKIKILESSRSNTSDDTKRSRINRNDFALSYVPVNSCTAGSKINRNGFWKNTKCKGINCGGKAMFPSWLPRENIMYIRHKDANAIAQSAICVNAHYVVDYI